jgi:hypothetical protein
MRFALLAVTLLFWPLSYTQAATYQPVQSPYSTAFVRSTPHPVESLGLRDTITLKVDGLSKLLSVRDKTGQKLVLYLNGMQLAKVYPEVIFPEKNEIRFPLERSDSNKETWAKLLSDSLSKWSRPVEVSLGFENGNPIPSERLLNLRSVRKWGLVGFAILIVCTGLLLWTYGGRTAALRIYGPQSSYSLAFVQMAFWFFLVISSYFLIWLIIGDHNTINDSILILLGIGSGTALGARIIDAKNNKGIMATKKALQGELLKLQQQNDPQTVPRQTEITQQVADIDAKLSALSEGFLNDLLNDENGVSLHRLQIVVWTCVLGTVFVVKTYQDLAMPEFSGTLMALMGISSGTYLGFKLPGQQ